MRVIRDSEDQSEHAQDHDRGPSSFPSEALLNFSQGPFFSKGLPFFLKALFSHFFLSRDVHASVDSTVASVIVAKSSFALEFTATEFPTVWILVSLCSAFLDGASTPMDEIQSRFANE